MSLKKEQLEISFDSARIDVVETSRLMRETYWGAGRTLELDRVAFENSLCVAGYLDGKQVAFGRAITDCALFAHISDILVWPEHRGRGFGVALVEALLDHPTIANIPAISLNTADAHGLYEKFGFNRVADGMHMKRIRPLPSTPGQG
ncbi:GNAT family N-acetyltransferase [Corticibacterium sp. UT-5YL-CI-8]|nr:GNAT family N-acetyltransferase [Tianweitania sp. UT-5YL-CI-8]